MAESKIQADFFDSSYGFSTGEWRSKGRVKDLLCDMRLWMNSSYRELSGKAEQHPPRRILITGVEVPSRALQLKNVMQALSCTRHKVTLQPAPFKEGLGKFQNINTALQQIVVEAYDWIFVIDDDIEIPKGFLNRFIYLAEKANLHICMPAHRFRSFQSYRITRRHWNSLARVTHFVECGPVTAFRRSAFAHVFPFPDSRWGWGTDILWSEAARNLRLPIGVVDAATIRHLKPVAASYDKKTARHEADTLLSKFNIIRKRQEILQTVKTISAV